VVESSERMKSESSGTRAVCTITTTSYSYRGRHKWRSLFVFYQDWIVVYLWSERATHLQRLVVNEEKWDSSSVCTV
jgi:hypothetical protein